MIIISDDISEALFEGRVEEEINRRIKERRVYKEAWKKNSEKRKAKAIRVNKKICKLKKSKADYEDNSSDLYL